MPFGIGLTELVILVIILIVLLFPGKIKEIAKNFGEAVKSFKKGMGEIEEETEKLKKKK
jgi:sec-independent protein translocase protein TatA